MSILVKRKRGRPRLDESRVINNFDSNLVDEVKKFPVLYDREHQHFKNKAVVNNYWRRVANALNASENVVRNRMFQLRNRFNVEKRRMETNPSQSNWPLYESLVFLFDFTKRRRRFMLQPKIVNGSAVTSSEGEDIEEDDRNDYITNDHMQHQIPNYRDRDHAEHQIAHPQNNNEVDIEELYNKKFKAFGEFLASSLIEMSEMQALHLVKKFTTDLVEYSKLGDVSKLMTLNSRNNSTNGDEYLLD